MMAQLPAIFLPFNTSFYVFMEKASRKDIFRTFAAVLKTRYFYL
jgi:hypothetical protein